VIPESLLKDAYDRLADSGEPRLWPGACADPIDDLIRLRIEEDLEKLFAALRVIRQRSVSEAKPSDVIRTANTVDNTATIQGPESEMADQHRDDSSNGYGCVPRKRFDPAKVELFPANQSGACSFKRGVAVPNRDTHLVEVLACDVTADDSYRVV